MLMILILSSQLIPQAYLLDKMSFTHTIEQLVVSQQPKFKPLEVDGSHICGQPL